MSTMLSHTRVVAKDTAPTQWMLVLHGIFGSGRNWGSIARRLVEARPEWGAVLVDLRLHGASVGFAGPHTLQASADDVVSLALHLALPIGAALGHSFGGKVALLYARDAPEQPRQVWVMDSTPAARTPEGSAWRMIEAVRSLPATFASRAEAVEGLQRLGYPENLGQWMAINLEPAEGRYRWRLDFGAMEALLRSFFATELWDVVEHPRAGTALHFVKATESDTMDADAVQRVEAAAQTNGAVFLHHLRGGHWINTDNPQGVIDLLTGTLPR